MGSFQSYTAAAGVLHRAFPECATEGAGLENVEDCKELWREPFAGLVGHAALQAMDAFVDVEYRQWLETGSQITECHHDRWEELVRGEVGKIEVARGWSYELSVGPQSLGCKIHSDSRCGTSPQDFHRRASPFCGV